MVQLNLIIALVFAGIALFIAARAKEWWLLAFAFVAGILLAGNKFGVTISTWINEAFAWFVGLFQ
jgi:hypothetical protein